VDSLRDINIIKEELIFKDMDISTKKLNELTKKVGRTQDKNIKLEYEVIKKVDDCFKKKL
jgi:ribosome-binding ATPase YchF (GTP1/OBG family)